MFRTSGQYFASLPTLRPIVERVDADDAKFDMMARGSSSLYGIRFMRGMPESEHLFDALDEEPMLDVYCPGSDAVTTIRRPVQPIVVRSIDRGRAGVSPAMIDAILMLIDFCAVTTFIPVADMPDDCPAHCPTLMRSCRLGFDRIYVGGSGYIVALTAIRLIGREWYRDMADRRYDSLDCIPNNGNICVMDISEYGGEPHRGRDCIAISCFPSGDPMAEYDPIPIYGCIDDSDVERWMADHIEKHMR